MVASLVHCSDANAEERRVGNYLYKPRKMAVLWPVAAINSAPHFLLFHSLTLSSLLLFRLQSADTIILNSKTHENPLFTKFRLIITESYSFIHSERGILFVRQSSESIIYEVPQQKIRTNRAPHHQPLDLSP